MKPEQHQQTAIYFSPRIHLRFRNFIMPLMPMCMR